MKTIGRTEFLGILLIGIISFTMSIVSAQPDEIIINDSRIFKHPQRTPVRFPHGLHMGTVPSCKDCHHVYRGGKNVLDESELTEGNPKILCSSCHALNKADGRLGLMDAFHIQCIGCHRKLALKGKKSGPRLCGQCHPWR